MPRTRLSASVGQSAPRPSAPPSRPRSKSSQNPIPLCDVFLSFGDGAEVESGSLVGLFRDSAPAKLFVPPRILGRPYFSTLPMVGLFFQLTRGAFWKGNVGAIGRCDDDVILKLLVNNERESKRKLLFQNKKTKNFPRRLLRNVILSFSSSVWRCRLYSNGCSYLLYSTPDLILSMYTCARCKVTCSKLDPKSLPRWVPRL